jgi:hypothetical protein
MRHFDWQAVYESYEPGDPIGRGETEQEAIDDLLEAEEPVAWMVYTQDGQSVYVTDNPTDIQEGQRALPLYTKAQHD